VKGREVEREWRGEEAADSRPTASDRLRQGIFEWQLKETSRKERQEAMRSVCGGEGESEDGEGGWGEVKEALGGGPGGAGTSERPGSTKEKGQKEGRWAASSARWGREAAEETTRLAERWRGRGGRIRRRRCTRQVEPAGPPQSKSPTAGQMRKPSKAQAGKGGRGRKAMAVRRGGGGGERRQCEEECWKEGGAKREAGVHPHAAGQLAPLRPRQHMAKAKAGVQTCDSLARTSAE
jgi:hypothetical protein